MISKYYRMSRCRRGVSIVFPTGNSLWNSLWCPRSTNIRRNGSNQKLNAIYAYEPPLRRLCIPYSTARSLDPPYCTVSLQQTPSTFETNYFLGSLEVHRSWKNGNRRKTGIIVPSLTQRVHSQFILDSSSADTEGFVVVLPLLKV